MVIPAEGPSFGIAPAGTWMWISCSAKKFSSMPSRVAFDRTHVKAACIDSCMTWPICPVIMKPPLPFMLLASTNRMSPPEGVQAKPTTTPARLVRSAISPSLRILMPPRNSCTISLVTTSLSVLPSAIRRACLRQMVPRLRSRLRTPASRV